MKYLVVIGILVGNFANAQSWGSNANTFNANTPPTFQPMQPTMLQQQQPTYITPTYDGGSRIQTGNHTTTCTPQFGGGYICN